MSLTAMLMDSEFFLSNWQELPAYAQWFYNADHTPSFRFVKACLQIIQRQTGTSGRPWLLKSPQNSRMISASKHTPCIRVGGGINDDYSPQGVSKRKVCDDTP